ncbi:Crp/Fnr family transcriptional regulator [Rhodoferax sp. TBRC 17660]|uniref:Crp/Fnr family transcriptional regulator n=1 Tax=Rhodoferax potami TaxID=3068338 RepID=A0ABU3KM75_9BURK|nr:Crp/Fnr family transcriptional regulator [Rhodoferax sp. TBRC 17660]MDT7518904.1 Crp/Fnr family transcriptional regulator [Rhodoferax sp. TBRC 17660]
MSTAILNLYPALAHVSPTLAALGPEAQSMTVPDHTELFSEGQPCQGFPLVLRGEVRVARRANDGRHLELYRVVPGELCLVSSAALFRSQALSAHGVSTKESELVMVSPATFNLWLDTPAFRNFVLGLFAERMADLTSLIDAVAFQKLDQRLANALLGRGQDLHLSHQTLADELGTVREMVTRLLRRFEREGWLRLGREHIHILSSQALRALAGGG